MTRNRRLVGAVTALVVVAALAVTAFVAHTGRYPKMLLLGGSSGSGNIHPGPPSTSWVFGSFDPCVTSGSVTVTGFSFASSANFVMSDWGYQVNHHSGTGVHPGTIASSGLHHGPVVITNICTENTDANLGDLFAFQVHRTSAATGWSVGLDATYRSGGASHVSHWRLGFALCGNTPLPHNDIFGDDVCSTTK